MCPWIKLPYISLLHYQDQHDLKQHDNDWSIKIKYNEINNKRIQMLPEYVRKNILA